MISSIVQLPEFSCPGTVIHGKNDWSRPQSFVPDDRNLYMWGGRDIIIPRNIYKYKIRMTDLIRGRIYTVVFVTFSALDLVHFKNSAGVEIFPLYAREYTTPGAEKYSNSNLALYIPGCNRLFDRLGIHQVCSVTSAIYRVIDHLALYSYDHLPRYISENLLSHEWGTTHPNTDDLVALVEEGDCERFKYLVDEHCILQRYFSVTLEGIMQMQMFGQMIPMIDPTHSMDPITLKVRDSAVDYPAYYSLIHSENYLGSCYVSNDINDSVNRLIYAASCIDAFEFSVNCATVQPGSARTLNPITLREQSHVTSPTIASIAQAANMQLASANAGTVVGSYLEDLLIYDADHGCVAFIDVVWWILASATGLVNQDIFYS